LRREEFQKIIDSGKMLSLAFLSIRTPKPNMRKYCSFGFHLNLVDQSGREPCNMRATLSARPPGGFTIETDESHAAFVYHDFSNRLQPERVAYGGGYKVVHERFEREGLITHTYRDCPERKSPAILTIFDKRGNQTNVPVPRVPTTD
jgi:hypothetical protein